MQKTIVEFGPEMMPVFKLFRNESFERIGKGVDYIAIDCNPEELQKFKNHYGHMGKAFEGDLRNIPLDNESADQIWLMNVFGGFENNPRIMPNGSLQYKVGFYDVFQELSRILKISGKLYIGEIYCPMRNISFLADADYSPFSLEKKVYKSKEEIMCFIKEMGGREVLACSIRETKSYLQFFLELSKK